MIGTPCCTSRHPTNGVRCERRAGHGPWHGAGVVPEAPGAFTFRWTDGGDLRHGRREVGPFPRTCVHPGVGEHVAANAIDEPCPWPQEATVDLGRWVRFGDHRRPVRLAAADTERLIERARTSAPRLVGLDKDGGWYVEPGDGVPEVTWAPPGVWIREFKGKLRPALEPASVFALRWAAMECRRAA